MTSGAPSADDAKRVPNWIDLDVDRYQEARVNGLADDYETTGVGAIVENERKRISKGRDCFDEGDAVLSQIAASLGWVPREPHA